MPLKKPRNSRDDKSNNSSKNPQKPEKPFAAFRPKPAPADGSKKPYAGKDNKTERKSFTERSSGALGERRSDAKRSEERSYQKPTGDRDFKPRSSSSGDYKKAPEGTNYRKSTDDSDFKPRTSSSGDYKKGPEGTNYRKSNDGSDFKPRTSASGYKSRDTSDQQSTDIGFKKRETKDRGLGEKSFKPRSTEGGFKKQDSRSTGANVGGFKASGDNHYKNKDGKNRTFKPTVAKDDDYPYQPTPEKTFRGGNSEGRPYRKDFGARPQKEGTKHKERYESKPDQRANRMSSGKNLRGRKTSETAADNGLIRLNRYIANAGICSRRKADELIAAGVVSVNGEAISELGYKVDPFKDVVRYNGEALKPEKMVYVILNKPKDYITTTDDPHERRTVMQLVEKASRERIYPVGRLDRNTTGLLLMTNDGALAEKLSHPRNNVTKLYHVELNKNMDQGDLNKVVYGLELEDGFIKPDAVSYVQGGSKREIGIQIHTGKNRIVRRIFEHLGYDVVKLDRVIYGGLTKKDLPRGRWRYLEEKEVIQLKHLIQ